MWRHLREPVHRILTASSLLRHRHVPVPNNNNLPTAATILGEDREGYMSVFPDVVHDLTQLYENVSLKETAAWHHKLLKYNLQGVKFSGSMVFLTSYKILAGNDTGDMKMAHLMGWCADMAGMLVVDDLMDGSEMRGGQPCWYKLDQVGPRAANDANFLNSAIYALMKKHYKGQSYYLDCLEVINLAQLMTSVGQTFDMLSMGPDSRPRLDLFTETNYAVLLKYKTSHNFFIAPVALAMYMRGIKDPHVHLKMEKVLLDMTMRYQARNDFMDCFGDFKFTGKEGRDIQEGKCSWLVINALKKADKKQLQECYGSDDPAKVARVKDLYEKLELPRLHSKFQEVSGLSVLQDIERLLPSWELQEVCRTVMNIIYDGDCASV